jgi:hypothetical protein
MGSATLSLPWFPLLVLMVHRSETEARGVLDELTGSPSEGFTEIDGLEDGMDDGLSSVSNPNPTQSVEASLPPVEARDRSAKSPLAIESWVSVRI